MKRNWTYRDLFDLEYFLLLDADKERQALHRRDREIWRRAALEPTITDNQVLLSCWLEARRAQFASKNTRSPGDIIFASLRTLKLMAFGIALLIGVTGGLSFFSYSGTTPVNVFHFLVLFVFSQIALVLILISAALLRLFGLRSLPSATSHLYRTLFNFFFTWCHAPLLRSVSAEKRLVYEQARGLFKKIAASHGSLLVSPLFTLSQSVMVCLNLGILTATLFRLATSDIAFGWQSTLQLSTTFIHQAAILLARPWSWLVPEQYAYPSLAEIEGSRIILKDGIYHLATADLVSWWPFLLFSLITYGLLLRVLLVLAGRYLQYRYLRRLKFTRPEVVRIVHAMLTPLVTTQAVPLGTATAIDTPNSRDTPLPPPLTGYPLTLLVPEDIAKQHLPSDVHSFLRQLGVEVCQQEVMMQGYESDRALLTKISASQGQPDRAFMLIFEAWMPPINDTLIFIKDLRAAAGAQAPIFVVLVGREQVDVLRSLPTENDRAVWRRKLDGLGDPFLSIVAQTAPNQVKSQDSS